MLVAQSEIDQKIRMHAVYASQLNKKPICVVADDTGAFILLLFVAYHLIIPFSFATVKNSDTEGISYQQNFTELQ